MTESQKKERRKHKRRYYHNRTEEQKEKRIEKVTVTRRLREYSLTSSVFNLLLEKQKNACVICQHKFIGRGHKGPMVDHDHKTGKVRGLLCSACNKMLGLAKDDTNILFRAIQYLEKGKIAHDKEAS